MVYESSYDSGRQPFKPDLTRGYWATPTDYIYTCISLGFRMDVFATGWFLYTHMGTGAIFAYIAFVCLFIAPIFVIQSFLGQFSSSGFIAAFRIAPLFKGIGYISLGVNLAVLTYYSVFAAIPLVYFFNSLRPTLPWSCGEANKWAHNESDEETHHLCNLKDIDAMNQTTANSNDTDIERYISFHVPSTLFFHNLYGGLGLSFDYQELEKFAISWEMVLCTLLTWAIIAAIFYKCFSTETMGKFLRYATWTTLVLMLISTVRISLLPIDKERLVNFFVPNIDEMLYGISNSLLFVLSAFGIGWGSIISLSSFNKFRTNIMSYSWFICLGQLGVFIAVGIMSHVLEHYHASKIAIYDSIDHLYVHVRNHWILYLSSGSALAEMAWPNFWSLLFFGMLALAAIVTMVTSIFSMLQSVFDEFELLRARRTELTFGLIGSLAVCSMYSCTRHGITFFSALSIDSLFTQTSLNLLLLLVVLWIYGRERFQRDIEFMLSQRFATWKVFMLRFVAPLVMLFILLVSFFAALYDHSVASVVINVLGVLLILIPWLCIPGYIIFILLQTTGSIKVRFQRCARPMDWYPVELEERQRYEEAMGNMDITHQLSQMEDEIVP